MMIAIDSYNSFALPPSVEYPPSGMTANTTTIGGQQYILTGSGEYNNNSTSFGYWLAFNKVVPANADQYISNDIYNTDDGTYPLALTASTVISGTTYKGAFVTLQLPSAVTITSYTLTSISKATGGYWRRTPYTWALAGSNNGTTWTLIDYRSAVTYSSYNQTGSAFVVTSPNSYSYYRLVVINVQPTSQASPSDVLMSIGELRLFA